MTAPTVQHAPQAPPGHRKPPRPAGLRRVLGRPWVIFGLMALLFVAFVAFMLLRGQQTVETEQRSEAAEQTVAELADPLAELCQTDPSVRERVGEGVCVTAEQADAVPGPQGVPGDPGRGIASTAIIAGRLVVTFSDGERVDVGQVVGPEGPRGDPGDPGRGITASTIDDGRLVLTFTDGTTQDLGPIVGERGAAGENGAEGAQGDPGRGIVSTQNVDGRLIITYDDGATQDAGPLPPGPQGPEGPQGPQGAPGQPAELPSSYTERFADGTSRTCTRAPDDADDTAPTYDCTERAPVPAPETEGP